MEFSELEVFSFLISAALVFLMVPGLALFYGGLVRHKNVIGTMMHSITAIGVVSVLWVLWGYSLAFSTSVGGLGFVGDLGKFGMVGVGLDEQAFMIFQGMFAIITVALIAGGFAERFKFQSYIIFAALWVTIVYAPLCHWVWGGGWLGNLGSLLGMSEAGFALDFAGGTVVHIASGTAALAAALIVGRRSGFGTATLAPDNVPLVLLGAGLLWVRLVWLQRGQQLRPVHRERGQRLRGDQRGRSDRHVLVVHHLLVHHQAPVGQRRGGRRGGRTGGDHSRPPGLWASCPPSSSAPAPAGPASSPSS